MDNINVNPIGGEDEIEIVEFKIGDNYFGVNVTKVREIIPYLEVTNIPNSHPCIKGIFKIRDSVISAVDLPRYLNLPISDTKDGFYIIAHFDKISVGFEVHQVIGIHRIPTNSIESAEQAIYAGHQDIATGIVKMDDRLVIIIDLEKILYDISPRLSMKVSSI